jgi:hypothetical protein
MANPVGESESGVLGLDFDRRLTLQFRGSAVTSDAGLLAYRELDDALGLTALAGEMVADARTGKNGRHVLVGLLRQSVFGRLAGYEDVNDAERLRHDPAMRWVVGGKTAQGCAASPSQMGRFETRWLATEVNLSALTELQSGLPCTLRRLPSQCMIRRICGLKEPFKMPIADRGVRRLPAMLLSEDLSGPAPLIVAASMDPGSTASMASDQSLAIEPATWAAIPSTPANGPGPPRRRRSAQKQKSQCRVKGSGTSGPERMLATPLNL